jgi:hypothetical protein
LKWVQYNGGSIKHVYAAEAERQVATDKTKTTIETCLVNIVLSHHRLQSKTRTSDINICYQRSNQWNIIYYSNTYSFMLKYKYICVLFPRFISLYKRLEISGTRKNGTRISFALQERKCTNNQSIIISI